MERKCFMIGALLGGLAVAIGAFGAHALSSFLDPEALGRFGIDVVILTTIVWAGLSHNYNGGNWVHLLRSHLFILGSVLIIGGSIRLVWNPLGTIYKDRTLIVVPQK